MLLTMIYLFAYVIPFITYGAVSVSHTERAMAFDLQPINYIHFSTCFRWFNHNNHTILSVPHRCLAQHLLFYRILLLLAGGSQFYVFESRPHLSCELINFCKHEFLLFFSMQKVNKKNCHQSPAAAKTSREKQRAETIKYTWWKLMSNKCKWYFNDIVKYIGGA